MRMIKSRMVRWVGHVARMGRREIHIGYYWESQMEREHREDQGLGGFSILKLIFNAIGMDEINWIHLAQDRDKWMALVNTVMNIEVP
jgi:hypothetical protein